MSRLLTWFSTKNGKRFTYSCVGIAIASGFSLQIVINGPYLEKYKSIFEIYRPGVEKSLSAKVQTLVQDVLKDCKISDEEKKNLKFFNAVGYNVLNFGGTNSPWGAAVGVPFTFEESKDIDFAQLKIVGKDTIDWVIDGEDLIEALMISDKAKKFALMREIYSCNFIPILQNSFLAAFSVFFSAEFIRKFNKSMNVVSRWSFFKRSIFYSSCYMIGIIIYKCFHDPLEHLHGLEYDKLSAEAGPEYLEGGIEFYTKEKLRNIAIRELLGPKGAKMYDEKGNEKYFLFPPRLPASKRLDTLKEMKLSQEKSNVSTQN